MNGTIDEKRFGTCVERGTIAGEYSEGYIVESLSRPGIRSRRIRAVTGTEELADGTIVFFCLMADGSGVILA